MTIFESHPIKVLRAVARYCDISHALVKECHVQPITLRRVLEFPCLVVLQRRHLVLVLVQIGNEVLASSLTRNGDAKYSAHRAYARLGGPLQHRRKVSRSLRAAHIAGWILPDVRNTDAMCGIRHALSRRSVELAIVQIPSGCNQLVLNTRGSDRYGMMHRQT